MEVDSSLRLQSPALHLDAGGCSLLFAECMDECVVPGLWGRGGLGKGLWARLREWAEWASTGILMPGPAGARLSPYGLSRGSLGLSQRGGVPGPHHILERGVDATFPPGASCERPSAQPAWAVITTARPGGGAGQQQPVLVR